LGKNLQIFDPVCIELVVLGIYSRLKWQHFRLELLHMIVVNWPCGYLLGLCFEENLPNLLN
jgi:hypothetical protein